MTPKTFIPDYEITQTITAVRLTDALYDLTGVSNERTYTIRPSSLRFILTDESYRIEGTGRKVLEDGSLSSVLYTVSVWVDTDFYAAPEWVLAILDGIR